MKNWTLSLNFLSEVENSTPSLRYGHFSGFLGSLWPDRDTDSHDKKRKFKKYLFLYVKHAKLDGEFELSVRIEKFDA